VDSTLGTSSGPGAVEPGVVLTVEGLDALIEQLRAGGWAVIGPTVRDGVVTHAEIGCVAQLPVGVGDEQDAAHYRLRDRTDGAVFGYTVSAASWKGLLFPARELLRGEPEQPVDDRPYALFGVRSCDLHALRIHDRVLLGRAAVDVRYARRRRGCFVVAVACTEPGGTCFCTSTGTGPQPDAGFDLCLTEVLEPEHRFVAFAGSEQGERLLGRLPAVPATAADLDAAATSVAGAAGRMGRRLQTDGLKELLHAAAEHPRWEAVAQRCLSCTNCTLVCPTCFCTTVEDTSDLAGTTGHRWRVWDSCFTTDFSYLHGGSVRDAPSARYRQWVTHKLASWVDQFGTSGCVGCGRCVTWCPVGIDLTAEVAAIRAAPWPTAGTQV
jgi:sulfhydrogenase subunit beta (sulfur reductase)